MLMQPLVPRALSHVSFVSIPPLEFGYCCPVLIPRLQELPSSVQSSALRSRRSAGLMNLDSALFAPPRQSGVTTADIDADRVDQLVAELGKLIV